MVKSSTMTMYGFGFGGLLALGLVVAFALIITLFVMWSRTDDKTTSKSGKNLNDVVKYTDEHSKHLSMLYSSPSTLGTEKVTVSGNGKYQLLHGNYLYPLFDSDAVVTSSGSFPSYLQVSISDHYLKIHATENVLHALAFSLVTKIASSNNGLAYKVLDLGIIGDSIPQTAQNLGQDMYVGNYYSTPGKTQSFNGATFFNFIDGHDYYFIFITGGQNVNNTYQLTDTTDVIIHLLV